MFPYQLNRQSDVLRSMPFKGIDFYIPKVTKKFIIPHQIMKTTMRSEDTWSRCKPIIGISPGTHIQLRYLAADKGAYFENWREIRPLKCHLNRVYKNLIFVAF